MSKFLPDPFAQQIRAAVTGSLIGIRKIASMTATFFVAANPIVNGGNKAFVATPGFQPVTTTQKISSMTAAFVVQVSLTIANAASFVATPSTSIPPQILKTPAMTAVAFVQQI